MTVKSYNELKKNLKKEHKTFKTITIGLLGDSTTQFLATALKGYGYEIGMRFDIFEAEYNQIERQVFDASSELYRCVPSFIIVFYSVQKLLKKFCKLPLKDRAHFAQNQIEHMHHIYESLTVSLACNVLFFNYPEINDAVFGNFANKLDISFIYQLRMLNVELMRMAQKNRNLFIVDVAALHHFYGDKIVFDQKMYINADLAFSLDFIPAVAKNIGDIIAAINGSFKKCLIMDLDNTLWGGVIGDDGLENIQIGDLGIGKAFTELQYWIKELKQRGIILAVCSKNDERIAKEPFEKHPDMILRLDDIAVFVSNWTNKADNIRYIQSVLNIGFDSMVFIDDNPFEREMVRVNIPDIFVPELPEDPAEYLPYLRSLNLFETASFSYDDQKRTRHYQQELQRSFEKKKFADEKEFLASLNMRSRIEPFGKFNIPRVAQLTQRSNQFNLRTIRYTEEDIQRIALSDDYITLAFTLEDKFGDNGLISIVILKKRGCDELFIDTWIMSCRVLNRGMEHFVLNEIVTCARQGGFNKIVGEYIPTAKNSIVKDHYKTLGFSFDNGQWILFVDKYTPKKHFIQKQ